MKLKIVDFETIELLMSIDCSLLRDCYVSWNRESGWKNNFPSQALVQMWLREEHGINIEIVVLGISHWEWRIGMVHAFSAYSSNNVLVFMTYEEALEAGIKKACEIIKEK